MRFPRVKAEGQSFYHCVSRVVDGRFIFQTTGHGSVEAERFLQLMRRLEAFSGVVILNYALMANHFHLLCEVPEPRTLSEAELLQRIESLFRRECCSDPGILRPTTEERTPVEKLASRRDFWRAVRRRS